QLPAASQTRLVSHSSNRTPPSAQAVAGSSRPRTDIDSAAFRKERTGSIVVVIESLSGKCVDGSGPWGIRDGDSGTEVFSYFKITSVPISPFKITSVPISALLKASENTILGGSIKTPEHPWHDLEAVYR